VQFVQRKVPDLYIVRKVYIYVKTSTDISSQSSGNDSVLDSVTFMSEPTTNPKVNSQSHYIYSSAQTEHIQSPP